MATHVVAVHARHLAVEEDQVREAVTPPARASESVTTGDNKITSVLAASVMITLVMTTSVLRANDIVVENRTRGTRPAAHALRIDVEGGGEGRRGRVRRIARLESRPILRFGLTAVVSQRRQYRCVV